MTESQQTEERYPLLFLFLDDGNKGSRKNKGLFFERSRSQGIMSGASAVLTQWPGHISSCGLVTIVAIMMMFFCLLMLLASSIKPTVNINHPRCLKRSYDNLDTNLFLVHDNNIWQQNELDTLETILTKYKDCNIELLILKDENNVTVKNLPGYVKYHYEPPRWKRHLKNRRHTVSKNASEEKLDLDINVGAKKLLKAFLDRRHYLNRTLANAVTSTTTPIPRLPTINDIIIKFPKLLVKNITKNDFFKNGPLYGAWKNFNNHTLNFAARILRLWENGGITFEIPHLKNDNASDYYKYDIDHNDINMSTTITTTAKSTKPRNMSPGEENTLLNNMIDVGYSSFRNLPEGLVTVDEEGIHMETKTTCHAFFGEALVQLKQANNETSVSDVIRNTLKTFCVRGAVDSEYCNSIRNK